MNCPVCDSDIEDGLSICPMCGAPLGGDDLPEEEEEVVSTPREKKSGNGWRKAAIILLVVLIALAGIIAAALYLYAIPMVAEKDETIAKLTETVDSLKADKAEQEETIKGLTENVDALNRSTKENEETIVGLNETLEETTTTLTELQATADGLEAELKTMETSMDAVAKALQAGKLGTASTYFKAESSCVVVKSGETAELKYTFAYSGTVSYQADNNAVKLSTGDTTATVKVEGVEKGVSVVTFTNTYNEESFTVLVLVTE